MGVGLVTSCFCINLLTGGVGVVPLGKDSYQAGGCLLTRERWRVGFSRRGQLPGWRLSL